VEVVTQRKGGRLLFLSNAGFCLGGKTVYPVAGGKLMAGRKSLVKKGDVCEEVPLRGDSY